MSRLVKEHPRPIPKALITLGAPVPGETNGRSGQISSPLA